MHPSRVSPIHLDERVADQRGNDRLDVGPVLPVERQHRLRGGSIKAAGEYTQPAEHSALQGVQPLQARCERPAQGSLTWPPGAFGSNVERFASLVSSTADGHSHEYAAGGYY